MQQITKDMIIADILAIDRGIAVALLDVGMHCLGCPAAAGESLEDACKVHGADVELLVDKINDYLESKSNEEG